MLINLSFLLRLVKRKISLVYFTNYKYDIIMIKTPDWYNETPCKGQDRLFFSSQISDRSKAKKICEESCPYIKDCLVMAVENELVIGVWGGKTGPEIQRLVEAA